MIDKASRISSVQKLSKSELSSGTFAHFKVLRFLTTTTTTATTTTTDTIDDRYLRTAKPTPGGLPPPPDPPPAATAWVTGTTPKKIAPRFCLAIPILILDAWAARTAFRSARRSVPHGRYAKIFSSLSGTRYAKMFPSLCGVRYVKTFSSLCGARYVKIFQACATPDT